MGEKLVAQNFELRGFIKNQNDLPISYINIENTNSKSRTISNQYGAFKLKVEIGDTLLFSSIGYENYLLKINSKHQNEILQIRMIEKAYELKSFQYKRKRNDSLAKVYAGFMKKDSLLNDFTRYTKFPSKAVFSIENGLVLRGMITQIWYQTSKKGKEMERLKLLSKLYQEEVRAEDKLNINFISDACGVPLVEAEEIKKHCKPGANFILNSNEYDLVVYIRNCAKNLKKE